MPGRTAAVPRVGSALRVMSALSATIDNRAEPLVSPVNSHNEWDPLEEIIAGRLDGATIPSKHPVTAHVRLPFRRRTHRPGTSDATPATTGP